LNSRRNLAWPILVALIVARIEAVDQSPRVHVHVREGVNGQLK
jgi:hypothetical protein